MDRTEESTMGLPDTDRDIVESINELALLAASNVAGRGPVLDVKQKLRLVPTLGAALLREGRPGVLLMTYIARTLDLRGELTISELARIIGRPLATTSRFVDGLETAGLVRRTPNPADGRSKLVSLTDAGRAASAELRQQAQAPLTTRLRLLTPAERRTLARLLAKLAGPEHQPAAASSHGAGAPGGDPEP